ncbi:MAG: hypothetical protein MHMPM18_003622, partial [Marteilia pararefringens]
SSTKFLELLIRILQLILIFNSYRIFSTEDLPQETSIQNNWELFSEDYKLKIDDLKKGNTTLFENDELFSNDNQFYVMKNNYITENLHVRHKLMSILRNIAPVAKSSYLNQIQLQNFLPNILDRFSLYKKILERFLNSSNLMNNKDYRIANSDSYLHEVKDIIEFHEKHQNYHLLPYEYQKIKKCAAEKLIDDCQALVAYSILHGTNGNTQDITNAKKIFGTLRDSGNKLSMYMSSILRLVTGEITHNEYLIDMNVAALLGEKKAEIIAGQTNGCQTTLPGIYSNVVSINSIVRFFKNYADEYPTLESVMNWNSDNHYNDDFIHFYHFAMDKIKKKEQILVSLAHIYLFGTGRQTKDHKKSLEYFLEAHSNGVSGVSGIISKLYVSGVPGIPFNSEEALKFAKIAINEVFLMLNESL